MKLTVLPPPFDALAAADPGRTCCRVIGQDRGRYVLAGPEGALPGRLCGKFSRAAQSPADYPAVGDYVMAEILDGEALIRRLLPRSSVFLRRSAGKKQIEQVAAANMDTVFLCMALDEGFNLRRLERYLSAGWDSGARPVVVLTKADAAPALSKDRAAAEAAALGAAVAAVSALSRDGLDALGPYLTPGQTVALLGSSGAGKSTLINALLGQERLAAGSVRRDGRGRHTTTRRCLLPLPSGAFVMDTPGMRELGLWDAREGLAHTFSEIESLAAACRFSDCTHTGEPGCAVQAAVRSGVLAPGRLASYRKLLAEDRRTRDAAGFLAEKREKFKAIAKISRSREKGGRP